MSSAAIARILISNSQQSIDKPVCTQQCQYTSTHILLWELPTPYCISSRNVREWKYVSATISNTYIGTQFNEKHQNWVSRWNDLCSNN